ncbi:MAG TPA: reverse transcriptase-like protein [Spirochaetota bacterium]|nr:reverse transcriptase-like protein [Spirochaetota bacterium]
MLLSIDRLLQLLSEGKSLEKISELANCEASDVVNMIDDARKLLAKHDKTNSKRKIIIKKKKETVQNSEQSENDAYIRELLNGTELSAIPVNASLVMYIAGESVSEPGNAGIGIIIFDKQNIQIGKVSDYIGLRTGLVAVYIALIRALKLSIYFQASEVKIRTDSEHLIRQLTGISKEINLEIRKYIDEINSLSSKFNNFKIEQISKSQNDKANFLAQKGVEKSR